MPKVLEVLEKIKVEYDVIKGQWAAYTDEGTITQEICDICFAQLSDAVCWHVRA